MVSISSEKVVDQNNDPFWKQMYMNLHRGPKLALLYDLIFMYQFRNELACLTYFYIIYSVYLHSNTLYESMNPLRPFSRNFSLYTYALISMNTLVEQTVAQLMDVEIGSFPKKEKSFFSQYNSKYEDQGLHNRFLTCRTGTAAAILSANH